MNRFTTPLDLAVALKDDGRSCEVISVIAYEWGCHSIEVPVGFVCDGASIPRFLWAVIGSPFVGRYRYPAVLHDFIYRTQPDGWTRSMGDDMFLAAMETRKTPRYKRVPIYLGVRAGGWCAWAANAKTCESSS